MTRMLVLSNTIVAKKLDVAAIFRGAVLRKLTEAHAGMMFFLCVEAFESLPKSQEDVGQCLSDPDPSRTRPRGTGDAGV